MRHFLGAAVRWGEGLRGNPIEFFEFVAEVGLTRKTQLGNDCLVGKASENQFSGKLEFQLSGPVARSFVEMLGEETL